MTIQSKRNEAILSKIKQFTEYMTKEPGANKRCTKYLIETFLPKQK